MILFVHINKQTTSMVPSNATDTGENRETRAGGRPSVRGLVWAGVRRKRVAVENHHGFSRRDLKADAGGKGSASHRERGEGRYEDVDVGERCRGGGGGDDDEEGDGRDFFDACRDVLLCLVRTSE